MQARGSGRTMARNWWWRPKALAAMVWSLGLALLHTSNSFAEGETPAAQWPVNYRQLMARHILADNRYVIRDAKITKPYEKWGGLLHGGSFSAVCVAIFRDNPFGIVVRDNWVLTIKNGRIEYRALGLDRCSNLLRLLS